MNPNLKNQKESVNRSKKGVPSRKSWVEEEECGGNQKEKHKQCYWQHKLLSQISSPKAFRALLRESRTASPRPLSFSRAPSVQPSLCRLPFTNSISNRRLYSCSFLHKQFLSQCVRIYFKCVQQNT